jgi:hypothetical protein
MQSHDGRAQVLWQLLAWLSSIFVKHPSLQCIPSSFAAIYCAFLLLLISDCRCFDASFDGEPFLQALRPLVSAAQPFCQTVVILTTLSYFKSRVFVRFFLFSSQVMKEMLIQTFGVPSGHRAAKPFHDHIISFFFLDGRVWLRHYQVPTNISTRLFSSSLCFQ